MFKLTSSLLLLVVAGCTSQQLQDTNQVIDMGNSILQSTEPLIVKPNPAPETVPVSPLPTFLTTQPTN